MPTPSLFDYTAATTSRYKVLERPYALPGKCVTCGATDRPVVDTNWNIDYYGAVYFCVFCLSEVARVIGMVDGSELREAEADSAKAFNNYVNDHNLKVVKNEQYEYWAATVSNLHNDFASNIHVVDVPVSEDPIFSEPTAVKDNGRTSKQKSKPVIDEGPVSVPDGNVDGDNPFNF